MRHEDIWRALDRLAARSGLSPSGLARRSGLDATTFNLSKRRMPDGRMRWPSTESLAKALAATGATMGDFSALLAAAGLPAPDPHDHACDHDPAHDDAPGTAPGLDPRARIPLIGLAQAGSDGFFDDGGHPAGAGWDWVKLPGLEDPNAYALRIAGDSMRPVFRAGDVVIVSPAAPVRRGDRVVLRTREGEVMAKEVLRRTAARIELRSLDPDHPDRGFGIAEIGWVHRIVWASQ